MPSVDTTPAAVLLKGMVQWIAADGEPKEAVGKPHVASVVSVSDSARSDRFGRRV